MEFLNLAFELDDNVWFSILTSLDFEGPMFHICMNNWIGEFSSDKSFCVENSVVRILGDLIFG